MAVAVAVLHMIVQRVEGECPRCGFDALVRIAFYWLSDRGVTCANDRIGCARCEAEERRERSS